MQQKESQDYQSRGHVFWRCGKVTYVWINEKREVGDTVTKKFTWEKASSYWLQQQQTRLQGTQGGLRDVSGTSALGGTERL